MDRRKKFLVALWAAFGLFWAFMAVETVIDPALSWHGHPMMLILQIGMVILCGVLIVRVIRRRQA